MEFTTKLKTAQQVAAQRLWSNRLDPAAYRCTRHGKTWVAEGPTNLFQFGLETPGDGRVVLCCSDTGKQYRLTQEPATQEYACNCPAAKSCKHEQGFKAVIQAARMARELGR